MFKRIFYIFSKVLTQSKDLSLRSTTLIKDIKEAEKTLLLTEHKLSHTVEISFPKLLNLKINRPEKIFLINKYEARIREILDHLSLETYELAIKLAETPKYMKGEEFPFEKMKALEAHILSIFRSIAYQVENYKLAHNMNVH